MITIRAAQMRVFRDQMRRRFVDQMLAMVREDMPDRAAATSEGALRETINQAINRAERYQLTDQPEVFLFVCATLMLGEGFDTDRLWAPPILTSTLVAGDKMKQLFAAIKAQLRGSRV